jgi:hypothetical protein
MQRRRRWARGLGLAVGIGSLPLWALVILWGYAFSALPGEVRSE